jgi:hypothetical protein
MLGRLPVIRSHQRAADGTVRLLLQQLDRPLEGLIARRVEANANMHQEPGELVP